MRNIGAIRQYDDARARDVAYSHDQLAVVWNSGGVFTAWPNTPDSSQTWQIETEHFQSDFNLAQAINLRRGGQAGNFPLSHETNFLTTIPEFSERTRILALDGERLALDDRALVEWLVSAEQQVVLGTDDHPIFETSLDDTACAIRRLPNGQVAMTELPRAHVLSARERVRTLLGDRASSFVNVTIETPVRAAARYFLTSVREGELVKWSGKESEVTAFILIGRAGFRFGLWSPAAGMFSEYGFLAPKDVAQTASLRPAAVGNAVGIDEQKRLEVYVREALDQLELQLSKEKLEQLQLSGCAQVVWASEPELAKTIAPIAGEHAASIGIEVFHLDAPIAEASAAGLLLGSFAFGDTTVAGASVLPVADLARDLLVLADTEQDQRRFTEQAYAQKRRDRAVFTLLAAPVAVAACLLAFIIYLVVSSLFTQIRESQAETRTQELKPALDRRLSYEANLKWYQEFIKQVSRLRKQQPVGIGLLYQLNSNYPFSVDPSFFVSDMKLQPSGEMEMKGFARNKDAVATFLKSMEFAGGPESGSRLFSNLAYEVQEGAPETAVVGGQGNIPAISGSLLTNRTAKPGVIAWSIKGTYVPMGEFAPPPPAKPGAPAPANTPPAAAKPTG